MTKTPNKMYESLRLEHKSLQKFNIHCRSLRFVEGILPDNKTIAWGIDPGVHFGLTVIEREKVLVFHGSFWTMEKPGEYGLIAHQFLGEMIKDFGHVHTAEMIIEGAAYGVPYRQVELSEIRTGFYLAGILSLLYVEIVPPKSIRKIVFGNGNTQAGDVWPTLNHNAADSLSMALYALEARKETIWL